MHTKRILVTGSAGFIGFHAAKKLKSRGDFVIGYDNFNTYYDPSLKRNRAEILKEVGIETIDADINQSDLLLKTVEENKITHILHLAAQAGVRYSLKHPEVYVESNLNGFVQILEILKRLPHIKLVYASSSSVYGLNTKVPFHESDMTDQPASFYGATKKSNELMAHAYHHLFGISVTGLRFFTVYGPWGRPDMAYASFTKAILAGHPIPVFGEGLIQRDFTYIDDIIAGTLAAVDLEARCEIFNLGNHKPQQVIELVHILEELLEKKAIIQFEPMPSGDVPITYADITKSQQHLGFKPQTTLRQGLEKFVEWHLAYHNHSPLLR